MIKKFEEFINEGFWKDGIRRAKNNTERLGDKLMTNIKNLNTVDLGVDGILFADQDLEIDGEDKFDWESVKKYIPLIEKEGWRIPTLQEIQKWFFDGVDPTNRFNKKDFDITDMMRYEKYNDEPFFVIKSWKTKEEWLFHLIEKKDFRYERLMYWLLIDGDDDYDECGMLMVRPSMNDKLVVGHSFTDNDPSKLRLVKDKK